MGRTRTCALGKAGGVCTLRTKYTVRFRDTAQVPVAAQPCPSWVHPPPSLQVDEVRHPWLHIYPCSREKCWVRRPEEVLAQVETGTPRLSPISWGLWGLGLTLRKAPLKADQLPWSGVLRCEAGSPRLAEPTVSGQQHARGTIASPEGPQARALGWIVAHLLLSLDPWS